MNTEVAAHPKLHHYGLTTSNLDEMIEWYRKVLAMTVNYREALPPEQQGRAPFAGMAFLSNDEADHRLVFFERRDLVADPDRRCHPGLQHVAFACDTLDDLLGTYLRLKGLGVEPAWAADHGVGTAFYYEDPDQNVVEINANNYGNAWTATEHIRNSAPTTAAVDPEKMVAAREAGASPWEVHKRAVAGEFAPTNRRVHF
jgi:catechol-2,3-dioxygenase